jgi:hypothetical protein
MMRDAGHGDKGFTLEDFERYIARCGSAGSDLRDLVIGVPDVIVG